MESGRPRLAPSVRQPNSHTLASSELQYTGMTTNCIEMRAYHNSHINLGLQLMIIDDLLAADYFFN